MAPSLPGRPNVIPQPSASPLYGRERELAVLGELLDGAGTRGGAIVVRGEAGIGKSALLAEVSRRASDRGLAVLTTTGVQSEAHLPFAGLHQLLRPVLGEIGALPAPQRAAVSAAFGLSDEAAPDPFLIALGALELLGEAAARSPLVLVVEDAHWLDRASCDVLAFVARRLELEPILLLLAVREGFDSRFDEAGLPELRLGGLDDEAAGALLAAHASELAPEVRARLLEEAAGNPLALVELPGALGPEQLGGEDLLPDPLPLTVRLERAFAARMSDLPAATRTLLLVAAVDDGGLLAEVLPAAAAIEGVEVTVEALSPAVSARLVAIDGDRLRFRHPLVRSAIHQTATVPERCAAHAALARVLVGKPDRSVWHRAAAVVGADEGVASELEAAATRAERRGAIPVAVAALERAARLTDDPARQGGRFLRAAEIAFELGRPELGVRLLREAAPLELDAQERIRLSWLREVFDGGSWSGAARVGSFVELADRMTLDGNADLALDFLAMVALRCWWGNPEQELRDLVVATAERIPVPDDEPRLLAIIALADPVERGAVVVDRLSRLAPDAGGELGAMFHVGTAATAVGAYDRSAGFLAASVAELRAEGRLGLLAQALVSQAWAAFHLGSWNVAMPAAEEGGRLARETGQPLWAIAAQLAEASLAALRGEYDLAESLATEAERVVLPMGANPMLALVQLARGLAALGGGSHADAYEDLRRMFDPANIAYHPFVRCWALADLVEAAVHSDHHEEAVAVVEELAPLAAVTLSPLLQVGLHYVRPLLADDREAEALFQAGLSADLASWPLVRARLLLAYGAWLRRQRRVAESRVPLRTAREAFDALGVIPWGERARQELRASGETSRRRTPEAWDQLTPQEFQIAQMAADGMTNREIGQTLYLSHRTVGSHLYRIFPKLGITSRAQLGTVLAGRTASIA